MFSLPPSQETYLSIDDRLSAENGKVPLAFTNQLLVQLWSLTFPPGVRRYPNGGRRRGKVGFIAN
jgi:hypothetical protein